MNDNCYIIIPVYNEAKVVGKVINSCQKKFMNVVCVNDGSSDTSAKEIIKAGAVLVNHPINLGAGAATQTGVDYALQDPKAEYFITIDADGQHSIEDAAKMLAFLQKNNLDIVMGSRFLGKVENISKIKHGFLKVAAIFSGATTGVKLTDPHIGLRVFNRRFAEALKLTMPDFSHASELVHRIGEGKFAYDEMPVSVTYNAYTKAKGQSMINAVNITFDMMLHKVSKK